ncbi:MAG: tyrosine-type recombinase/integrase [Dehalococcoidia bacterium]|nr:tyrosine-type recombinase/integrase [Dehalococcoidia bacterium]
MIGKRKVRPEDHSTSLAHLDDYLLQLQADNYSPRTIYNYERDLRVFDNFLRESKMDFSRLDKRGITYYKAYLASHDRETAGGEPGTVATLDARSVNRMLSALRSYLKFLVEMDFAFPLPPEAIKLTKATKKHSQIAELDALTALVESPSQLESNPAVALRNRAMLEVLLSTGMRISELCGLKRSQIDGSGRVFITGKGRKQRFVYLTERATHHLDEYLKTRTDNAPALFIPYSGRNVNDPRRRISTNYLQERIKRYRERLQINVPTSAHSLRHGFATYLAEGGANPAALQILLGHESLVTTTRYVHASDRYAEETQKRYHPRA